MPCPSSIFVRRCGRDFVEGGLVAPYLVVDTRGFSPNAGTIKSKAGQPFYHFTLANRWNIPVNSAKQTVTKTTQRGVRTCLTPSLSWSFLTNYRMLRYDCLPRALFSDTLISGSVSKCGNKYSQMYGAYFGWAQAFPIAKKGDTHEALSLLFKRDWVPPKIIVDKSKEQILVKFNHKLKKYKFHLRQTDPYSPWSNTAKGIICETNKGSSRKIIRTWYSKKLWDHCIEQQICPNLLCIFWLCVSFTYGK